MYEIYLELLKSKGLKSADVARATGIAPTTFTDWKNGKSKPKEEKLKKIADFLGVTTEYLRTGKEEEKKKFPIPDFREEMIDLISYYSRLTEDRKALALELIRKLGENP